MATLTFGGQALKKPFAWSFSKLKNFETCPKRHWHIDLARDVKEEESEHLAYGDYIHKAFAKSITENIPLPIDIAHLQKWVNRYTTTPGDIKVEQKLAIDKDLNACSWFGNAWFRGIGDVVKINDVVALIADWKTGKVLEDSVQLALMAACVFAHYPNVQAVMSEFVWLKHDAYTREVFRREQMAEFWRSLWPRIEQLVNAHERQEYPPKPNGLCKRWCPVVKCPHHGE